MNKPRLPAQHKYSGQRSKPLVRRSDANIATRAQCRVLTSSRVAPVLTISRRWRLQLTPDKIVWLITRIEALHDGRTSAPAARHHIRILGTQKPVPRIPLCSPHFQPSASTTLHRKREMMRHGPVAMLRGAHLLSQQPNLCNAQKLRQPSMLQSMPNGVCHTRAARSEVCRNDG